MMTFFSYYPSVKLALLFFMLAIGLTQTITASGLPELPTPEETERYWACQQTPFLDTIHEAKADDIIGKIAEGVQKLSETTQTSAQALLKRIGYSSENLEEHAGLRVTLQPQLQVKFFFNQTEDFYSVVQQGLKSKNSDTPLLAKTFYDLVHHLYFEEFFSDYLEKLVGISLTVSINRPAQESGVANEAQDSLYFFYNAFQMRFLQTTNYLQLRQSIKSESAGSFCQFELYQIPQANGLKVSLKEYLQERSNILDVMVVQQPKAEKQRCDEFITENQLTERKFPEPAYKKQTRIAEVEEKQTVQKMTKSQLQKKLALTKRQQRLQRKRLQKNQQPLAIDLPPEIVEALQAPMPLDGQEALQVPIPLEDEDMQEAPQPKKASGKSQSPNPPVPEQQTKKLRKKVQQLKQENDRLTQQISSFKAQTATQGSTLSTQKREIAELKGQNEDLETQLAEKTQVFNSVNGKYSVEIQTTKTQKSQIKQKDQKIQQLVQQKKQAQEKEKKLQQELSGVKQAHAKLEAELEQQKEAAAKAAQVEEIFGKNQQLQQTLKNLQADSQRLLEQYQLLQSSLETEKKLHAMSKQEHKKMVEEPQFMVRKDNGIVYILSLKDLKGLMATGFWTQDSLNQ